MDEYHSSFNECGREDSSIIQQLSSGVGNIVIDKINYPNGLGTSNIHESTIDRSDDVEFKMTIDPELSFKMSQDPAEDAENQVEMSFLDASSTSKVTKESKEVKPVDDNHQATDAHAATNDNRQKTLGCFTENHGKAPKKNYQSYSNLINRYCCKCKVISKSYTDTKCFKCQSSLQFQCKKCSSLHINYIAVFNHIKYVCYKLPKFRCSICNYTSFKKCSLIDHKMKHTPFNQTEYPHQCSVCKKKFKKEDYLLNHERICDKKITLACPRCPYKTKSNEVLAQHIQKKHPKKSLDKSTKTHNGKRLYTCDHCNVQMSRKLALAVHIRIAHPFFYKRIQF